MIQGEYVLNFVWSGMGMEQVWNGYGTDTQLNITFQVLHLMAWNGGVGIRGLDPELWIGVWIGMCARLCSGPFISIGSHITDPTRDLYRPGGRTSNHRQGLFADSVYEI